MDDGWNRRLEISYKHDLKIDSKRFFGRLYLLDMQTPYCDDGHREKPRLRCINNNKNLESTIQNSSLSHLVHEKSFNVIPCVHQATHICHENGKITAAKKVSITHTLVSKFHLQWLAVISRLSAECK